MKYKQLISQRDDEKENFVEGDKYSSKCISQIMDSDDQAEKHNDYT